MKSSELIVGRLVKISFPEFGVDGVVAKIDTGAYSGALHCSGIRVIRRIGGRRTLKFNPLGDRSLAQETTEFEEKYVRSASGHRRKRFLINTTIRLDGKDYVTKISLSERRMMKREVLIGRKFLRENNILVDVRISSEQDEEGKGEL